MTKSLRQPKSFDYGALSLADREALRALQAEYSVIARKSSSQVFELGRIFTRARELLPRRFEKWVSRECSGMTPKTAGNYMRIVARFGDRQDVVEALGLKPTSLIKLATAPDEAVNEVFARAESGEALIGTQVEAIIRSHRPKPDKAGSEGAKHNPGRKGLTALVNECNRISIETWFDRLAAVHAKIMTALPGDDGPKKFRKGDLVDVVSWQAKWLLIELERMTGFNFWNKASDHIGIAYEDRPSWPSGPWKDVYLALHDIDRMETIKLDELEPLLRNKIVPVLEWALERAVDVAADGKAPLAIARAMDPMGIRAGDANGALRNLEAAADSDASEDGVGSTAAHRDGANDMVAVSHAATNAGVVIEAAPRADADHADETPDEVDAVVVVRGIHDDAVKTIAVPEAPQRGWRPPPFLKQLREAKKAAELGRST
ncbi:hypothetical protein [Microvirga massiliensis]|uniref:hypothetical protein n=1 Tax=Microvirga massiliensis TaxID=1033741 RepID=UPI00062B4ADB|nr:hypothetical protein [Microvirga massiliensis]